MPNNWKTYKLNEVTKLTTGFAFKSKDYENIGTLKVIRGINVTEGKLRWADDSRFWNHSEKEYSKYLVELDDIVIGMDGSKIGKNRAIVRENDLPSILAQRVARIQSIVNLSCQKYIWQLINNSQFENYINNIQTGTSIPHISLRQIGNYEIKLPSYKEQQSIASILSAIDDKIENNLAINKTLEEMATALYKHWFVDFGPFQDGEFIESELGMIPKGWELKRLDDLIEVVSKGTTPRMKDVEGLETKIPFLKVKDINSNGEINTDSIELIPEEIHLKDLKRSILNENDLLFSIAGTIGRVSIVTKHLDNSNCNQALAFIRLTEKEIFKSFIYYWLKSDEVQNRIQNSIVQGVQANVSLTVLKELEIIIPPEEIIKKKSNKLNPILELIIQNQEENRHLKKQKDALLPKLISGEVRLKEFQNDAATII